MQTEFERLIQLANPDYVVANKIDSDTIFYFLNAAQNRFIKLNYMSLDNLKQTVENLRKNTDTFKALIVNKTIADGTALQDGVHGKQYELPSSADERFFLYLRSFSYVSGTYMDIPDKVDNGVTDPTDNKVIVSNKLIMSDEIEKIIGSYYNMPILRQPCAVLESNKAGTSYLSVYTDSYTKLKGCNLTYIRMPKKFNVIIPVGSDIIDHCELSENVHQDIVELAVDMFFEDAYKLAGGDSRRSNKE